MFTGIVEETGVVRRINTKPDSTAVTIIGKVIFDDLKLGDSVSVSGVCLTVSELSGKSFTADVMRETLSRTSIGSLKEGSRVNLERAMPANGRFGGHIVSGHIDGTGVISDIRNDGNAFILKINAPEKITRYIVEKGSVAIDGVSLTVIDVATDSFRVSIIPHTSSFTTLSEKSTGDIVNLENDIVGKYIEKFACSGHTEKPESGITMEFLSEFGYAGG